MTMLRTMFSTLALLLAAATTGCGGGGGGGAPPAGVGLLDGQYGLWLLSARDSLPDRARTFWGTAVLDGMGSFTASINDNLETVVVGPVPLSETYTVAADRETVLFATDIVSYAGWTNASGTLAVTGSITPLSDPTALALIKRGSGFSLASLSGTYRFGAFGILGAQTLSYFGTMTFDGAGSFSFLAGINNEGAVSPPGASAGTYTLAANGEVGLLFGGGDSFTGTMLPDGGMALLSGGTLNGEAPLGIAITPTTAGATDGTLTGTYQLIGIERNGGGYTSLTGSVVANGSGVLTASFTRNTDGAITTSGPDLLTYSVAADGTLTVDPLADMFVGGVSPTGDYAFLSGPSAAASNPKFFVLMRR